MTGTTQERIAAIYRAESRRVLATLIRLLGDFELADLGDLVSGESAPFNAAFDSNAVGGPNGCAANTWVQQHRGMAGLHAQPVSVVPMPAGTTMSPIGAPSTAV